MKETCIYFNDRELYVIAQGLQCLSYMMENGYVKYNEGTTEEMVNSMLDEIAIKIANARGVDLTE